MADSKRMRGRHTYMYKSNAMALYYSSTARCLPLPCSHNRYMARFGITQINMTQSLNHWIIKVSSDDSFYLLQICRTSDESFYLLIMSNMSISSIFTIYVHVTNPVSNRAALPNYTPPRYATCASRPMLANAGPLRWNSPLIS